MAKVYLWYIISIGQGIDYMTKVWHQQAIGISQIIGWMARVLASYAK